MKKLNIGCGLKIKKGWINLDNADIPNIDVQHDLNNYPYPFKKNEFDKILVSHVLEHFTSDEIILIIDEFHRILKPNGILHIFVPYYNHPSGFCPIDHKTQFTFGTFKFITLAEFSVKGKLKRWNIISEKGNPTILGKLIPPFTIKKIRKICWNGYIEKRNINLREFFSYIFGYIIKELEIKLQPIK